MTELSPEIEDAIRKLAGFGSFKSVSQCIAARDGLRRAIRAALDEPRGCEEGCRWVASLEAFTTTTADHANAATLPAE